MSSLAPSPMLLSVYEAEKMLRGSSSWYISEKYDGWRMMYFKGVFYSRTGQELAVPAEMRKDIDAIFGSCGDDLILDGELWLGYNKFTETQSALNTRSTDLKFLVFDMPSANGTFEERLQLLSSLFTGVTTPRVKLVEQVKVSNTDTNTIDSYYDAVVTKGGEGIVLKPSTMMYEFGKRSDIFLKRKPWDTMDVKIVGYFTTEAQKSKIGYVSSLICEMRDDSSKNFKVQYKSINPPCIGAYVTIKYSQSTVTGLPKFAQLAKGEKKTHVTLMPQTPPPIADALTVKQWMAKGGYVLKNEESVYVKSNNSDEIYTVKRAKQGDSVYCSCYAWKYQKMNPMCRTCKHCTAVLGAKADAIRVAKAVLEKMN